MHRLYWLARLTLVNRQQDIELFDRVFEAAFGDAVLAVDPNARGRGTESPEAGDDVAGRRCRASRRGPVMPRLRAAVAHPAPGLLRFRP